MLVPEPRLYLLTRLAFRKSWLPRAPRVKSKLLSVEHSAYCLGSPLS